VRALAITVALLTAASTARADDDEGDEDGAFVANKSLSMGIAMVGHGTRLAGKSEQGFGTTLELALGRDRWQYFVEGGIATSHVSPPLVNTVTMVDGRVLQGGLGARWIARQFRPDSSGGIELFLLSCIGMERFYLEDNTRTSRAELAFGFGLQARVYKRPRLAFRLDARVLATPNDSPGFAGGIGFAW
jgi:hypothetical protein